MSREANVTSIESLPYGMVTKDNCQGGLGHVSNFKSPAYFVIWMFSQNSRREIAAGTSKKRKLPNSPAGAIDAKRSPIPGPRVSTITDWTVLSDDELSAPQPKNVTVVPPFRLTLRTYSDTNLVQTLQLRRKHKQSVNRANLWRSRDSVFATIQSNAESPSNLAQSQLVRHSTQPVFPRDQRRHPSYNTNDAGNIDLSDSDSDSDSGAKTGTSNEWACDVCTFANGAEIITCAMCGRDKPGTTPAKATHGQKESAARAGEWSCEICTFLNPITVNQCSVCKQGQKRATPLAKRTDQHSKAKHTQNDDEAEDNLTSDSENLVNGSTSSSAWRNRRKRGDQLSLLQPPAKTKTSGFGLRAGEDKTPLASRSRADDADDEVLTDPEDVLLPLNSASSRRRFNLSGKKQAALEDMQQKRLKFSSQHSNGESPVVLSTLPSTNPRKRDSQVSINLEDELEEMEPVKRTRLTMPSQEPDVVEFEHDASDNDLGGFIEDTESSADDQDDDDDDDDYSFASDEVEDVESVASEPKTAADDEIIYILDEDDVEEFEDTPQPSKSLFSSRFSHFHSVRELENLGLCSIPFHSMFLDHRREIDCKYEERRAKRVAKGRSTKKQTKLKVGKSARGKSKASAKQKGNPHAKSRKRGGRAVPMASSSGWQKQRKG